MLALLVAWSALATQNAHARGISEGEGDPVACVSASASASAAVAALPIMSLLAPASLPLPAPGDDGPGCWLLGRDANCRVQSGGMPSGPSRTLADQVAPLLVTPAPVVLATPDGARVSAARAAVRRLAAGHLRRLERPPRLLTVGHASFLFRKDP